MKVLITGGTGFFGSVLKSYLQKKKIYYVNFDLFEDKEDAKKGIMFVGDLTRKSDIEKCFQLHGKFDVVCHLAAQLAHDVKSRKYLWDSNVRGTKNIIQTAIKYKTKKIIFTSSNCLWGEPFDRKVTEADIPDPIEIYGQSKWEGEKIVWQNRDKIKAIIFRSPTIMSAGRMGLLTILYEFMDEDRKIWLVGDGSNHYQFIYAPDYADAIYKAITKYNRSATFNIGSDNVHTFREIYQFVITKAKSQSKIFSLPKLPLVIMMKIAYLLKLSPLGPYQYKMISESFVFDTQKIKKALGWQPTKTNQEMLYEAYLYYKKQKSYIEKNKKNLPAHKKKANMGIISLLKWFS